MTPHRRETTDAWSGFIAILAKPAVFLLVALALRVGVAFFQPLSDDFMHLMEPGRTAVNLAAGRGYTFDFYGTRPDTPLQAFLPPLHPWLIALALQSRKPALAYGLVQALLGTLTVWLLYRLATGMAGRRVGLLTGWGASLYPPHLLLVGQPHSTVLTACCLVAVLLASWRLLKQPGVGQALVTGGLVGVSTLGRPQAMLLAPIIVGWLWLNGVQSRQLWRPAVVLMAAVVAVILPWSIRNTLILGQPTFISTNAGVTFWNGNNPFTTGSAHDVFADRLAAYRGVERDPGLPDVYQHPEPYPFPPEIEAQMQTISERELDRAAFQAGLDYIRQYPLDWLELEGRKLMSFWWFRPNLGANPIYKDHWTVLYQIQYPLLLMPALAGIVLSARGTVNSTASWRRFALLYAVLILYTLTHVAFNVLTRYRWEIELLLILFASLVVDTVWQRTVCRQKTS